MTVETAKKVYGFVRHGLGAMGGFMIALGWTDADTWMQVVGSLDTMVGAGLTLAAFGWSMYDKFKD